MRYMVLDIDIDKNLEVKKPTMACYLPDNSVEIDIKRTHKTIVICPGGAYMMTSDREAEPIALKFLSAGFNCFVLRYSVDPVSFPTSLLELSKAVAIIRENAQEWNVDVNDITVCGFSAGGHLAASLATMWNRDFIMQKLGIEYGQNKPNKVILGYPVISSGEYA
ncbi:MAG: alpha/beta hydrolase, partial [Oscillospiraceae bacterium]